MPDTQASATQPVTTHYVYVLRCADGSLYAGYTVDLQRRLAQHQAGKGAKYTRAHRPVELVASWPFPDRATAMRAELAFKRLDRDRKLAVVGAGSWEPGVTAVYGKADPLPSPPRTRGGSDGVPRRAGGP